MIPTILIDKLLQHRDVGYVILIIGAWVYMWAKTKVCPYHKHLLRSIKILNRNHKWAMVQMLRVCNKLDIKPDPMPDDVDTLEHDI